MFTAKALELGWPQNESKASAAGRKGEILWASTHSCKKIEVSFVKVKRNVSLNNSWAEAYFAPVQNTN